MYHNFFQKYAKELEVAATSYKYQVEDASNISSLFEVAVSRVVEKEDPEKSFCCHLIQALSAYAYNGLLAAIRKKSSVDVKIIEKVCLCFESILSGDMLTRLSKLISTEQWTKLIAPFFDSSLSLSFEGNLPNSKSTINEDKGDGERVYLSIQAKVLNAVAAHHDVLGFSKIIENVTKQFTQHCRLSTPNSMRIARSITSNIREFYQLISDKSNNKHGGPSSSSGPSLVTSPVVMGVVDAQRTILWLSEEQSNQARL
jgi:hypothetical protein